MNDLDSDTERQWEKNEEENKESRKYLKFTNDIVMIHLWFVYAAVLLCHAWSWV